MRSAVLVSSIILLLFATPLLAQQSPTYAEEYALYQQAQSAQDPAQQKALVLQFVEKFKTSELDQHIGYLYAQYLNRFAERQQWETLASEAEPFLRFRPGDKNVAALAVDAYRRLGQPDKLVQFGTRLYNQSPSGATAYIVAKAYQSMNDAANFQKWAERTLQHAPGHAEMLVELINIQWQAGNLPKAAEYASRALKSIPEQDDTAQARAFALRAMGQNAYMGGDAATAQKYFVDATKLDPKNDFAHLQLGYCYWRTGKVDDAIRSFARAVALKGSSAKDARQQLYSLLKTRYGNTQNASSIIEAAAKELGVS